MGQPLVTAYIYSDMGDLTDTSYSDGATPSVSLLPDRAGRIVEVEDAAGKRTLSYTARNQKLTEAFSAGLFQGFSVERGYDDFARLETILAPGLVDQSYGYDPTTGRLETVETGDIEVTYAYLPDSNFLHTTEITLDGAPHLLTARVPDGRNRLESITSASTSHPVSAYTYVYDTADRRRKATLLDGSHWDYDYNTRGEVTNASRQWPGGQPAAGQQFGFAVDAIGNRLETSTNGRQATWTPNAVNEYESREVPAAFDLIGTAHSQANVTIKE